MINLFQMIFNTESRFTLMESPDNIFSGVLRVLFILGSLMYLIFAGLVIRQVSLMGETVKVPSTGLMKLISLVHFAIAVVVFLIYIMIL